MADGNGPHENDPGQDLSVLILRPLNGDDPLRPALAQDLSLRLTHIPPNPGHESVEVLASRLRKHPGRPERSLLDLALSALILLLGCLAWEVYEHLPLLGSMPGSPPALKQAACEQIFISNEGKSFITPQEYAEQLWQADPENPVAYFGYFQSYLSRHGFPPPDYHETWSRIDPDNGMWAICEGESILGSKQVSYTDSSRELALRLFLEAAEKPLLHFYREEWLSYFRRHLRSPDSLPGFLATRSQMIAVDPRLHLTLPIAPMILRQQLARPDGESPIAYRRVLDWIETETNIPKEKALPLNEAATIPAIQAYLACWSVLAIACLLFITALVLHLRKIPSRSEAGKLALCFHQLSSIRNLTKLLALTFPAPVFILLALFAFCHNEAELVMLPLLSIPSAWLAIVTTLVALCDSQISRQTGAFGFNSPKRQRHLNTALCLLAYLSFLPALALKMGKVTLTSAGGYNPWLILPVGITSAVIIISLSTKVLLGYSSPEAGIRHRLIARRLLPAVLLMTLLLSGLALILHEVERAIIRSIVAAELTGEKPL